MFHLDTLATLVAATLTLLLGRKLVHSVSFLKKYTIPEPVAGGLLVALALLVLKKGTVAKLAMRQPFVLFKGLTFQKLCLPGAFRPGDHHNKMLRPG
ncbi:sodium/glutamate symporter, partial [Escherichia coli]